VREERRKERVDEDSQVVQLILRLVTRHNSRRIRLNELTENVTFVTMAEICYTLPRGAYDNIMMKFVKAICTIFWQCSLHSSRSKVALLSSFANTALGEMMGLRTGR